jgi:hypothetical protein
MGNANYINESVKLGIGQSNIIVACELTFLSEVIARAEVTTRHWVVK